MTKKIILIMVEGPSDEDTLALVFSRLIREQEITFAVLHGDITAGENMTAKYIEEAVQAKVAAYLYKNPFIKIKDILKVVQIIDTDGAFVSGSQIIQSDTEKTKYFETYIEAKDKNRLVRRNISKRAVVFHLMKMTKLNMMKTFKASVPYEIYYFSRNLEHVLHDISTDLKNDEKEELAYEFADYYSGHPVEFLKLLYEGNFYVAGDYEETWKFIMEQGNSLKRYCNLTVFFEKLGVNLEG